MRKERGTSPEYPDIAPLYPRYFPTGLPPEHTQHDIERIAEEHSREDEALQRHKKPSLWKRFLGLVETPNCHEGHYAPWPSGRVHVGRLGESHTSAWWVAFLLIGFIFAATALIFAERR